MGARRAEADRQSAARGSWEYRQISLQGVEYYDNGKASPKNADFEVMAHFTEKGKERDEMLMDDAFTLSFPADFAEKGGTVTVSYSWTPKAEEGEEAPEPVVKTAEVPVTLTHVALETLTIRQNPYRIYYSDTMSFDKEGMTAVAEYNDGSVTPLYAGDLTVKTTGALEAGAQSATVAYTDGESEVTAEVPITVVPKAEYNDGKVVAIDPDGEVFLSEGQSLVTAVPPIPRDLRQRQPPASRRGQHTRSKAISKRRRL